ncbi:phosphopyruvate hydratase [Cronobacter sakazakii 696]|nr:phosphopyruvate hydratase [Cronobacter sakazakii 696]
MRDDSGVASVFRHFDRSQSFGQRTDLVEFDQDGVSDAFLDAFFQDFGVGNEQVVAHQLDFVAQHFGLVCKTIPVRLVQTVFDGNDRVLFGQVFQEVGELFRGERFVAFARQNVFTVFVEFRCCAVHRQGDVFAQFVTRCFYRFSDNSQSFGVRTQVWRVAAFVTHCGVHAFAFQHFRQVMENFRTHADGFFNAGSANRLDHEFLDINVVVSVLAAVDDVHHRNRHREFARSAVQFSDVLVQRHAFGSSSSFSVSQRNGQNGVCTEVRFVFSTVQIDHDLVDTSLIFSIFANDSLSDRAVNRANRFGYAFAQETGFVAIAQFQRFAGTSGST